MEAETSGELVRFDADRKARFLTLYALTGKLQLSARQSGISPMTVREHLKTDVGFRCAVEEAKVDFQEAIEGEIARRAIFGWEEPVYQQGLLAGHIRKFDSRLLELYAKRHIPEYKERHEVNHTGTIGLLAVNQAPPDKKTWAEEHAEFEELPNESDQGT